MADTSSKLEHNYEIAIKRREKRTSQKYVMKELAKLAEVQVLQDLQLKNEFFGRNNLIEMDDVKEEISKMLGLSIKQYEAIASGYKLKRPDLMAIFCLVIIAKVTYAEAYMIMNICQSPIGSNKEYPFFILDNIIATMGIEPHIDEPYDKRLENCDKLLCKNGLVNGFEDLAGHKTKKQKKADRDRTRYIEKINEKL